LFLPVEPVMVAFPLARLGYSGLCCVFFSCFLSLGYGRKIQLKWSSLASGCLLVSSTVCFGWIFIVFFSDFEARSTHVRRLLLDTRHPATFPVVFRPCYRKHRSCQLPVLSAWPSRARGSSLSDCAWKPRSTFSGRAWRPGVHGVRSPIGCLRWRVSYTSRHSGEVSLFASLPVTCFWVFFTFVFVYSPCFPSTVCLCIA